MFQVNVDSKTCFVGIVFASQQSSACVSQPVSQSPVNLFNNQSAGSGHVHYNCVSSVLRAVRPLFAVVDEMQFEQMLGVTGP